MTTVIDRLVSYISPLAAVKRAQARAVLAYYEAGRGDKLRKQRRETGTGNTAVQAAGLSLRQQARHLEQNYDIALGVINVLVNNVVGVDGIGIEPQPRRADGTIDDQLAREIMTLWRNWCKKPEVTWCHDWASSQRMIVRSWLRDGECFVQLVEGTNAFINHGTLVPFSVEMLECDFVPLDFAALPSAAAREVVQGIEIDSWGRPTAYNVYKSNPLESGSFLTSAAQVKKIPAERMLHIAHRHRIRQLRGVSIFASVMNRFDDLKDYEESERIAAKVAACFAAYIKKGSPDLYAPPTDTDSNGVRQMKMAPAMIFDDLSPGEDIGFIDSKRPNPNLETFRSGQVKAIASGTGVAYSSAAKSYDGTYSAQRQEMIEGYAAYGILSNELIGRVIRPVYERFIALAKLSGTLKVPPSIVQTSLDDAVYVAPKMPWIDPEKEASAWAIMEDRSYISGSEIVRSRGGNPLDVIDQQARWLREKSRLSKAQPSDQSAP